MFNKSLFIKIVSSIIVVGLAVGLFLGYRSYINSKTEAGKKEITVQVIVNQETIKDLTFKTDADFLGAALDEKSIIETQDSSFGRFVVAAGGVTADSNNQEWWLISVNGEGSLVGVDDQAIHDKDVITIELLVGYDNYNN